MDGSTGGRARFGRRKFLALGTAGAATFVASAAVASWAANGDPPPAARNQPPLGLTSSKANVKTLALAATDGFVSMPTDTAANAPYFPDPLAVDANGVTFPAGVYTFGFRDVTGLERTQVQAQRGQTQISAPLVHCSVGDELWLTLTNLGLATRPDLVDSHTMHWHGFRNAIPFYDGVPETSVSVPIGRDFTYVFRPKDPGTYMYHCHFEDVEHVTMGMTGIVYVYPEGITETSTAKRAYDAADTAFDREYAILLTEIDTRAHFNDAHIQATDWTDFHPDFWLMNGRGFPDTLAPNVDRNVDGSLPDASLNRLGHQPHSSLIVAKPGDKVLIRLANLGFQHHTLTMPGIPMTIVGRDARYVPPVARRADADIVELAPGESRDVIITAPATPGDYAFYNRDMTRYTGTSADQWVGGQRTVIAVRENLGAQPAPNQWPLGFTY